MILRRSALSASLSASLSAALPAALRAAFGTRNSLHRKLTVNIVLALLVAVALAAAVLIYEFFEHLEENVERALEREAAEILYQAQPERPHYGYDTQALRFRGAAGAYRYTVFDPDLVAVAGGEVSDEIRAHLSRLPLGMAGAIPLAGERRGMGICGDREGRRVCVLASAYAPLTDNSILSDMVHELEEQVQWVLVGSFIVLVSALLAARLSLRPLEQVLREARDIGPDAPDLRLTAMGLPDEIVPLVEAVNNAFARLEKGYQAQRAFSANVAHEVRTPLAVLHSSVDAVEDPALRRRLNRDLARLETIFAQLIDLARADALVPAAFEPLDLRRLALQIACDRAPETVRAGRSLAVTGAQDVMVRGNAGLLSIALDNLVRNALAYGAEGSEVEIDISAAPAALRVLDRGPGIPIAERTSLFERFRRGTGATKSEGSGLGLAIVQAVAEAHGATVRIEPRPGGGSVFVLEFATDDEARSAANRPARAPDQNL